jgi:hypothetical protein
LSPSRRCYRLFGLRIASEIDLPELFETERGLTDIVFKRGTVVPLGPDAVDCVAQVDGGVTVEIPEVARFHIRDGREIIVDAENCADPRSVRVFLLGTASGVLIHQRGLLPLHANAVELGSGAVAFSGESGAGKSTLAAWFHDRGARIVADDVCVIGLGEGGEALAMPGLPRFRLWREALERSGRSVHNHLRSFGGNDAYDKYDVAIAVEGTVDQPLALRAIFLLARGPRFEIARQYGVAAAEGLFANTYRGAYVNAARAAEQHYNLCVSVLARTPVFQVTRSWELNQFEEQAVEISTFISNLT